MISTQSIMAAEIGVTSEIGRLRKVIVHRPDAGIARISPRIAEELLFDDIVFLPQMQQEHDLFTGVLRAFMGSENVLEAAILLQEALEANPLLKSELLQRICAEEELPNPILTLLEKTASKELAEALITGYCAEEDFILFDPIPNFIFTRDIAVVVNRHVILTKAAKVARFRENLLTRFIFSAHPMFEALHRENRIINLNDIEVFPPSRKGESVSIEGGDVMVINSDYLLVGSSERSSRYGIHSLARKLFELGVIRNVVLINIPSDRSFMHIDTVFTHIHRRHVVAYKPLVTEGISSTVEIFRQDGSVFRYASVQDFFHAEIDPRMEFIYSGNGLSPYQEREQWTDGCNLLALRPGVALAYDRNPRTEEAFRSAGYDILPAETFMERFTTGGLNPERLENTIITLPSSELSRARGGSHCMSCPILRE
jgi:arginine deiminase